LGKLELYSVPIAGPPGAGVRLNKPLESWGDVVSMASSPDGSLVVYTGDQETDGAAELYSVPSAGPASAGQKLNDPLVDGGDVAGVRFSPDGSKVIYRADQDTNNVYELYVADSGAPPTTPTATPTETPTILKNYLPLILRAWQRPTPTATPTVTPTPTITPTSPPTATPTPVPPTSTPTATPEWTNTPTVTPTREPGSWLIEDVDCQHYAGRMDDRSLRLDDAGRPHIAYGGQQLYHAWRNGSWQVETVDDGPRVGAYASLDLDADGYAHISYRDADNTSLKYAYADAGGWHLQTLDNSGDVGEYTSIALDSSGHPHIIYYDETAALLRYTYQNATGWHTETIATGIGYPGPHSSLTLDGGDRPHVSLYSGTENALMYAYRSDTTGWQTQTVDSGAHQFTSIALDSGGQPHISYYHWSTSSLKYAYRDATGWHTETVGADSGSGWYTAIALGGGTHISYQGGSLDYAYHNPSGWLFETVDSGGWSTGLYTSLALDQSTYPHVSYYDEDADCLKYAYFAVGQPAATATPTSTRTPTSTPTPTRTPTSAPTAATPQCIDGRLSFNGAPAPGITLDLRFHDGSSWSSAAITVTGGDGRYCFMGVSSLGSGQKYYVRYGPNITDDRYLRTWLGPDINTYASGSHLAGGDFDIANVGLVSPDHGATVMLPTTFTWSRRELAGDSYRWGLFDPDGTDAWWTSDLGDEDSFELESLRQGVSYGKQYGWNVFVWRGPDSYGSSFYARGVTFSAPGRSAAPSSLQRHIPKEQPVH